MRPQKKILIVDDQPINRKILNQLLGGAYTIVHAENGQEALSILRTEGDGISAVLLDLVMPTLDGYGVLEAMAEDARLSAIPVIVVSQSDKGESEEKALALGARDFISKPYNPGVLRRRLANLIELYESNICIGRLEHDALTGLYNKDAFCRRAAELLAAHPEESYLLVATDIERFKLINDSFGSSEGDRLLRYLGEHLLREVQAAGGICARHSADHFVALVPKTVDDGGLRSVVARAEGDLSRYPLNMRITLKFGVYPVGDLHTSVSIMCDRAILAADSAKGRYDNPCAYYDESILQRLLREQQITDEMKRALKEGQFQVYLQPKYDLLSERIAGAEALVRWTHPKLGSLSPAEFIPLFEKNGFITELDQYIWEETCAIMARWMRAGGKYVPVSVNVSRRDIYKENLPELLSGMVARHGLLPGQLHLEITETAYTENSKQLIDMVGRLKKLGFSMEMDDFGTGYSSLNMLSELPIDILKLDMRLIQQGTEQQGTHNILSFVISLAKWMDLLVVAEGVETQEQIDLLRTLDCNYVQGYYFAKPMPAEEFTELLLHSNLADPIAAEGQGQHDGALSPAHWTGKKNLLIADSDAYSRSVLAEYFQESYVIVEADSGISAYRCVQEHFDEIAVVLLHLLLPGMDGATVLKKMQGNPLYSEIPVILIGGCGEEQAFALGASDLLQKPYHRAAALRRVQNVTAHNAVQTLDRERRMLGKMKTLALEAKLDQLTGLYNRLEMERQVREFFADAKGTSATFLMLDIDNFKTVNDTYGHGKGDEAIRKVAEILQRYFREDDIVCRMGGDEFSVFISAPLKEEQLRSRLAQLCQRLRFRVGSLSLSCSIGSCTAPEFGRDYQELYHNADVALLTAKRLGKNQYQIYGGSAELPDHVLYRNMDWLLDEASNAVYICDAKTYEIYYLNNVACALAGKEKRDCVGAPCYQVMWNRTAPCEHCIRIDRLTRDYCEHEFQPAGTEESYILKGKLMDWGSREARIQYVQDNSRRAKLARQMEELSEDRNMLLNLLPGGLLRYRADSRQFNFVSDNTLHMLGYSPEEFAARFGNCYDNLIWEADRLPVEPGQPKRYVTREYRIQRRDGELRSFYETGYFHPTQDGGEFYVMLTDVTELQQLRQRVQEQRDILAAAMEHSGMLNWEFDFETQSSTLTPQAQRELQLPGQMAPVPQAWIDAGVLSEADGQRCSALMQELRGGKRTASMTLEITHPRTRSRTWTKLMYTVYRWNTDGCPLRAVGTALDITEQKQAEQKYAEESAFRSALSAALVASFRINLTTGEVEEARSTLGIIKDPLHQRFTDETFRALCVEQIIDEEKRERCYQEFLPSRLLRDYKAGRTEKALEYPVRLPGSEICWVSLRLKMMRKPSTKEVVGFFGFFNISEEKRLEQVLSTLERTDFDVICTIDAETGRPAVVFGQGLDEVLACQKRLGDNVAGVAAHLRKTCYGEDVERAIRETEIGRVREVLRAQEEHSVSYRICRGGGLRYKRIDFRYMDAQRSVILCTIRDYTDIVESLTREQ